MKNVQVGSIVQWVGAALSVPPVGIVLETDRRLAAVYVHWFKIKRPTWAYFATLEVLVP